MRAARAIVVALALALGAGAAAGQEAEAPAEPVPALPSPRVPAPPATAPAAASGLVTIDVDRLFAASRLGARLTADLNARTDALEAENERLRQQLTEEEGSLADRRPAMELDAFRAEADAFDARVQRIRAEQDGKQAALEASVTQARQDFLAAVTPVLAQLMAERGAVVILERRDVFLASVAIDITDDAVAAVDRLLGDGGDAAGPDPAPEGPAAAPGD